MPFSFLGRWLFCLSPTADPPLWAGHSSLRRAVIVMERRDRGGAAFAPPSLPLRRHFFALEFFLLFLLLLLLLQNCAAGFLLYFSSRGFSRRLSAFKRSACAFASACASTSTSAFPFPFPFPSPSTAAAAISYSSFYFQCPSLFNLQSSILIGGGGGRGKGCNRLLYRHPRAAFSSVPHAVRCDAMRCMTAPPPRPRHKVQNRRRVRLYSDHYINAHRERAAIIIISISRHGTVRGRRLVIAKGQAAQQMIHAGSSGGDFDFAGLYHRRRRWRRRRVRLLLGCEMCALFLVPFRPRPRPRPRPLVAAANCRGVRSARLQSEERQRQRERERERSMAALLFICGAAPLVWQQARSRGEGGASRDRGRRDSTRFLFGPPRPPPPRPPPPPPRPSLRHT